MPASFRLLPIALLILAAPARADGPGPVPSAGRPSGMAGDWEEPGGWPGRAPVAGIPTRPRPARRVMGGPDYVGSDYGLGKPAFYGLGSRPDWGRSSTD